MSLIDRYAALPLRLHRAVRTWLAIGLISALLPTSAVASVGVLAQPWFWAGVLPLLVLLPYRRALMPQPRAVAARRVHSVGELMLARAHRLETAA